MARSGSYDFIVTRQDVINRALRQLGVLSHGDLPHEDETTAASLALNMMLKSWQDVVGLWLYREYTLFVVKDQATYTLGPTGDNASLTSYYTTASADADSGDLTITVTSDDDITDGDYIGIQLDDGNMQWTTVNGVPSSDVVTITDALTDDVTSGAAVYNYTDKPQRPVEIVSARYRLSSSDTDTNINVISRDEYDRLSDKTTVGTPSKLYYEPLLDNGKVYLWPVPNLVTYKIILTGRYPMQDMDGATDNFDLPAEWGSAITLNLAVEMGCEYADKIPAERWLMLVEQARKAKAEAMSYDGGNSSLYFVPDQRR